MNRVKHCLSKMTELVNNPGKTEIIDLDLLLDYTKIVYAEVLEQRRNLVGNQIVKETVTSYKENKPLPESVIATSKPKESKIDLSSELLMPQEEVKPKSPVSQPEHETSDSSSGITPTELKSVGINFENPSDKAKTASLELIDLRKLIPLNDKFAYVIELFNEGNEEYEDAINHLNTVTTYGNTMEWVIANLQNKYNWDVENDLVVKFYDAIKSRFSKNL